MWKLISNVNYVTRSSKIKRICQIIKKYTAFSNLFNVRNARRDLNLNQNSPLTCSAQ
jgi:hypothetical protein